VFPSGGRAGLTGQDLENESIWRSDQQKSVKTTPSTLSIVETAVGHRAPLP
jgi:hypothetical protein